MGNIIQFPAQPPKSEETPSLTPNESNAPVAPSKAKPAKSRVLRSKKVQTQLAIVATVLLGSYTFSNWMNSAEQADLSSSSGQGRQIASVAMDGESRALQSKSEAKALSAIREKGRRSIASLGQTPSAEDKLRFETLDSRYLFNFHEGRIETIQFTPDWSEGGEPRYVLDRSHFLKLNRSLLPEFQEAQVVSRVVEQDTVIETYSLVAQAGPVATVAFELDRNDRLLSMKVQENR